MAGLPIRGGYYHEYIPSDEELSGFRREGDRKAYHSKACLELFHELQQFNCITKIHYEDWSVYFSHGLMYALSSCVASYVKFSLLSLF